MSDEEWMKEWLKILSSLKKLIDDGFWRFFEEFDVFWIVYPVGFAESLSDGIWDVASNWQDFVVLEQFLSRLNEK